MAEVVTEQKKTKLKSEFDPKIMHMPENPTPSEAKVISLLDHQMQLTLKDERVFKGKFTAFDKIGNIVLDNAEEYYRGQVRKIPMVVVPFHYVTEIASEKDLSV